MKSSSAWYVFHKIFHNRLYCKLVNSFVPGICACNFKSVIFGHMSWIQFMSNCKFVFRCMPQNYFDDKSTMVQKMTTKSTTNHYLDQCWSWTKSSYGVTSPRQVNLIVMTYLVQHRWYESLLQPWDSDTNWMHCIYTGARHGCLSQSDGQNINFLNNRKMFNSVPVLD